MNIKNKSGPNIEPCGTPHVTQLFSDIVLPTETTCDQRYDFIISSNYYHIYIFLVFVIASRDQPGQKLS